MVVEPDQGGETVVRRFLCSSLKDRIRLVTLGAHKDPRALYLSDREGFKQRFEALLQQSISLQDSVARQKQQDATAAYPECEQLLMQDNILDAFVEAIKGTGYVGQEEEAQLLFLAIITRLFKRPVSVVVKGPSSAGKSHLVKTCLSFFPDSAYYALSAMSDKALLYLQEPLDHRFLVIYEAHGIQGENGSYFMRTLLSEGCLDYSYVVGTVS